MRIGQKLHVFFDGSRKEPYGEADNEIRSILTSIYYPAVNSNHGDEDKIYAELFAPCQAEALELLKSMGVDESFFLSLKTRALRDAEPNEQLKEAPVILLSPAFGVVKDMYMFLIEKLVACGLIVVAVGATYESIFSAFPDGTCIIQAEAVSRQARDDEAFWQELLRNRVEDIRYVIGHLDDIGERGFGHRLSSAGIGIVGHSLGGAAAFEAAKKEERIAAVIMLDPSFDLLYLSGQTNFMQPVLVMRQEKCTSEELEGEISSSIVEPFLAGYERLHSYLQGYTAFLKVEGAHHLTFCDVPLHNDEQDVIALHDAIRESAALFMEEFIMGRPQAFQERKPTHPIAAIDHHGNIKRK